MRALATTLCQIHSAVAELVARTTIAKAGIQIADQLGHQAPRLPVTALERAFDYAQSMAPTLGRQLWTPCVQPGMQHVQHVMQHHPLLSAVARGFATAPDREQLIDQRLKALSQEHHAMLQELHGARQAPVRRQLPAQPLHSCQLHVSLWDGGVLWAC
jgi:hypothetical protein